MGYWVYCHGSINVVAKPPYTETVGSKEIVEALGRMLDIDSEEDWEEYAENPKAFTPSSADGVVQYRIVYKSSIGVYRVKFDGALGDTFDLKEVVDWWYEACSKLPIVGAEIEASDDFKNFRASIGNTIFQD